MTLVCFGLPAAAAVASQDPEDLDAALGRDGARIGELVRSFGGALHQRVGGAAVVAFGVPVAHEDDAERAVRAALRAVADGIAQNAGVAGGEAFVSTTADVAERIAGRVIADAIELQHSAPAGRVLVDEVTVGASGRALDFRRRGRWWVPQGERRWSSDRLARSRSAFVGRDRELAMLGGITPRCASAASRLVTIVGEAGIGKMRLVDEFVAAQRARSHARIARWLEDVAGERRSEFIDLLAHHYEAAADPGVAEPAWRADAPEREEVRACAVQALLEAGTAARRRLQTDEATRYAERAGMLATSDAERLAALELKAGVLHDALRADDALSAYLEAFELARRIGAAEAMSRLRAHVPLLSAFVWAFTGEEWQGAAAELVEEGLRERGDHGVDFETGALLIGRTLIPRWRGEPVDPATRRRDLTRVAEIAEAIHSPELLAAALDPHYTMSSQEGLCETAELGERLVAAARQITDPPAAHESLVSGSCAFFFAGRFDAARKAADRAVMHAEELSTHRRLHAVSVQSACLAVDGRIADLLDATVDIVDLVREEGERTCPHGGLALARRALALYESGDPTAAAATVEFLDTAMPLRNAGAFLYRAVEILRPLHRPRLGARRRRADRGPTDRLQRRDKQAASAAPAMRRRR